MARAATCGAWVTVRTWTRSARRASRAPMASDTAPPTAVSISSKTSVGALPRSASATLSASMKRESSPPDATLTIGPGCEPGLVCTQNSTRSRPSGPPPSGSVSMRELEARALQLQRRQLCLDRGVERPGRPAPRLPSFAAAPL